MRLLLASIVLGAVSQLAVAAERPPALPFIENDFDKALATAGKSGKPILVEVWAPW